MEIRSNTLQATVSISYSPIVRSVSQEVSDKNIQSPVKQEKIETATLDINKQLNELVKKTAKEDIKESNDPNKMDKKQLEEVIKELQEEIEFLKTKINFRVEPKYDNSWLVQVINKDNDEVLRQFPPEYLLKISKSIKEMIKGILVDEKT
jgi:flagellar protein FlaG